MKRCPTCNKTYTDEALNFCLDDGAWLAEDRNADEASTAIFSEPGAIAKGGHASESAKSSRSNTTDQTAVLRTGAETGPHISLSDATEKRSFAARRDSLSHRRRGRYKGGRGDQPIH